MTDGCDLKHGTKGKVLVTGGAGYIGSHCCKSLAAAGYRPVVYDNLSTGHRDFVKWGPLIEGDIRDREYLRRVIALERPVAVMHFAALALVGESVEAPERYWDVNVGGTFALLEAMRANGCEKLVFSSSCAVYGEPTTIPIDEATMKAPVNPYGSSKLTAEWMMESYDRAYGLRSVRLRYFNACGADPDGEIGYHSLGPHLLPLVIDTALGKRAHISVFGTDYPTADGTAIRDYIHVLDLADAHIAALELTATMAPGQEIANLGSGSGFSVKQVLDAASAIVGEAIPYSYGPRRVGDPPALIASNDRARELLDWEPHRGTLREMIGSAWQLLQQGKAD
jgi:UDP-glucose-4-epimerase GalE